MSNITQPSKPDASPRITLKLKERNMSPVIRISDDTYRMLQELAMPFVDTPETVIRRLLEETSLSKPSRNTSSQPAAVTESLSHVRDLDPDAPDGLHYTRIIKVRLGDREMTRTNWNRLAQEVHVLGIESLGSFEKLSQATPANVAKGKRVDNGYTYLPNANFSLQGMDARNSWLSSLAIARALSIEIEVLFEWIDKPEAAYPGEKGRVKWEPKN